MTALITVNESVTERSSACLIAHPHVHLHPVHTYVCTPTPRAIHGMQLCACVHVAISATRVCTWPSVQYCAGARGVTKRARVATARNWEVRTKRSIRRGAARRKKKKKRGRVRMKKRRCARRAVDPHEAVLSRSPPPS